MCGICGIFKPDGGSIDSSRVEKMRDAMEYRGPDGLGFSQGKGYALGHRRLAIIDLSDAGLQPMSNEDGTVEITFNGEIYNFLDLRPELEAAGHRFRSRTDSEVLIHGYEEWGIEGLLKRIRGMYAFALVDTRQHVLHLARDPLGEKPLFFRIGDGELAFASSARALAHGLKASPEIHPAAIVDLLRNLYIPGPQTIFAGVEKLAPGHALSIGRDGKRQEFTHWAPDFFHAEQGISEEEWLERIEAALTDAIRRQLIADVPLGVMLSGGVDSSLVTALAAGCADRLLTFSVATEDLHLDESRFAQAVAERYGTEHHVLPVRSNVRQNLPRLVAAMGEPLGDPAAANLFAISQVARRSVTVVLTGDGGDEAFGGYSHFFAYHYAQRLSSFLPGPVGASVSLLGSGMRRLPGRLRRAGTLLQMASAPVERTYGQIGPVMERSAQSALLTSDFQAFLNGHDPGAHYLEKLAGRKEGLPVDRVMQAHLQTMLADEFLPKGDLATMGASLEARCPFLDLDVIELAMRIPASVRFSGNEPKGLLRRLARRHVPIHCVDRRKQGFLTPMRRWIQEWPDLVEDLVLGKQVERRGWFRRQALQQIVEEQRRGTRHDYLLWALMILELWIRMAVDGSLCPGDTI